MCLIIRSCLTTDNQIGACLPPVSPHIVEQDIQEILVASLGLSPAEKAAVEAFKQDVIERSEEHTSELQSQ